ncbi:MlaD family protein, partial [Saccharomonospora iraqiensis]|uniref:MlaD family protein n=1 Tax=Saccharomonospora iraqiensis TaxID=52698 RepID=UPI00022E5A41
MRNRLALTQLALFAVIGLACGYYVVTDVAGPGLWRDPLAVTVRMPDTGGLTPSSRVTYRGVDVGEVTDVRIDGDGAGVAVDVALDPGTRVSEELTAVVTMDTPIAIVRLDLRPSSDEPPYLSPGDVVTAGDTRRPVELDALLARVLAVADDLPAEDIGTIADALATGLGGGADELVRILDNTRTLLDTAAGHTDEIRSVLRGSRELLGSSGGRLRELAASLRGMTDTLREHEPAVRELVHEVDAPARRVAELMTTNQPALTTLLGNLVTTGRTVSLRGPAVEQLLASLPETLTGLGDIVEGDTARFYLVGAQGPVCYHGTDRRTPVDTEPRQPELTWHCPPGERLAQRGAANAPRPD